MFQSTRAAFRDGAPSSATLAAQAIAARAFRASAMLRTKAVNAGQVADFVAWQEQVWGMQPPLFRRRERLWTELASRTDPSRPLLVLEFGVAWGYATDWWLRRLGGRDVTWHGFDRFTGLPRSWREHAAGAFDAGGTPPAIADPRVHWHVGDVQDTLPAADVSGRADHQRLILFDLDIYEPTAFAWDVLAPDLQPGDLMYFDAAMDADERRVLDEKVLPAISCAPVGSTSLALGLQVTAPVAR
jgi:hypothetical protein